MKKLISGCFMMAYIISNAQVDNNEDFDIFKDDKFTISIMQADGYLTPPLRIEKVDIKTKKAVYQVNLNIPDKTKDEMTILPYNKTSTVIVDDDIQIIYDVLDKKGSLKKCYIKTLGIKGSPLSNPIQLSETPCKSKYTIGFTIYRVIYSPDKLKFALLLDNFVEKVFIEPSITIFDSKKATPLSIKKLKSIYNGDMAQIDPYNNFKLDNAGNISLIFNTYKENTKDLIKSYKGDIPFAENDIKNIKEVGDNFSVNSTGEAATSEQGRFYNSYEDYLKNKPANDIRIKRGSHVWGTLGGEALRLIDKNGEVDRSSLSKLPTSLFTYRGDGSGGVSLHRVNNGYLYYIMRVGNICLYSHIENTGNGGTKDVLYYSEGGINADIKKFKENDLEGWLEKASLLESYKKDAPKREFKDDKSDYYTKEVARYLKYIDILNKK